MTTKGIAAVVVALAMAACATSDVPAPETGAGPAAEAVAPEAPVPEAPSAAQDGVPAEPAATPPATPAAETAAEPPAEPPAETPQPAPVPRADCVFEDSEPWPQPKPGTLATMGYPVSDQERPFAAKVFGSARLGMTACMKMKAKVGDEVAWFGVVRGHEARPEQGEVRLLVENKHFDGLTDTHILCLSFAGGGDFVAILPGKGFEIQPLGVLRVYGKVVSVKDGVPRVEAAYARQFRWGRYCFMMVVGETGGNQEWRKLCKVADDAVYDPFPDPTYYADRLGDPSVPGTCDAKVPAD